MAIYRGDTKVSGVGKGFNPENSGTEGQVLTKTATGYAYDDIPEVTVDSALSTTSENPVQNKVITNAIQNAGGASDHLEEKAPVGELYTLNDDVFLQQTPDLDDSTIEQAVGNTADNTQIHIQRVSSGTASNKLKLKIKKVGNPGDLTVQVMKGISVVVTADVEAYWYGDSSNTIATGTLSSSSVTTSFQELEVTLNASFGGAQEELLNVVLSQASVDASNYYVIACDSTQWSEGFSFVAVNGNTRTRSKVMPYCTSAGFAQGLLCKVSDTVIPTTGGTVIYSGHTESVDYDTAWNNGLVMYTNNSGGQQTYKVDLGTYCSWGNNGLYVGPKTGQYNNPEGTSTGQYNRVYSNSTPLTIEDGESLRAYCAWGRSGVSGNVTINSLIINPIDYTLVKTGTVIYPRVQGGLGITVSYTTFGRHIDNTFITIPSSLDLEFVEKREFVMENPGTYGSSWAIDFLSPDYYTYVIAILPGKEICIGSTAAPDVSKGSSYNICNAFLYPNTTYKTKASYLNGKEKVTGYYYIYKWNLPE